MLVWGKVTERADRILIVASGPSLRNFDLQKLINFRFRNIHVIAINRSIDWLPRVDSFFSLDPNTWLYTKLKHDGLRIGTTYYLGAPSDYGMPGARIVDHRVTPISGVVYLQRFLGHGPFSAKKGLSTDKSGVNTGNSCYGALGLAFHMNPSRIAVLGLDGTQEPYADGSGAPVSSLSHLPALFASAVRTLQNRRIQVINGSPTSKILCFPRTTPEEALEWLIGK
jgi:hypothetical protein